jgi:hypothetical protein
MENNYTALSLDNGIINMHEYYAIEYWTNKFGTNREALQKAVDAVGNSVDEVRKYLK